MDGQRRASAGDEELEGRPALACRLAGRELARAGGGERGPGNAPVQRRWAEMIMGRPMAASGAEPARLGEKIRLPLSLAHGRLWEPAPSRQSGGQPASLPAITKEPVLAAAPARG